MSALMDFLAEAEHGGRGLRTAYIEQMIKRRDGLEPAEMAARREERIRAAMERARNPTREDVRRAKLLQRRRARRQTT